MVSNMLLRTAVLIGASLLACACILGYVLLPIVVSSAVLRSVLLTEDTSQMEHFKEIPFPLSFKVYLFNVTNTRQLQRGGVPVVKELGPYVYKLYRKRQVEKIVDDRIAYRIVDHYEFDAAASYPHTEDDQVTMVNLPFNAILQTAEHRNSHVMPMIGAVVNTIFAQYNESLATFRVGDLTFGKGIRICAEPGLVGGLVCAQIRNSADTSKNIVAHPDGSITFSLFSYRNNSLSEVYIATRGTKNPEDLGRIVTWGGATHLRPWGEYDSTCNMINGTDSGIYAPFVDKTKPLYAYNPDICRSVELKYQYEWVSRGVKVLRYAIDESYLSDNQGCFCLGQTAGVTDTNGCLLSGAMELNQCVGSPLVLTNPHFLYSSPIYALSTVGVSPFAASHEIFIDIEPLTGTVMAGSKRAQFNIFLRTIHGIPHTAQLPGVLTPVFWIDEGMVLPNEYAELLRSSVHFPTNIQPMMTIISVSVTGIIFTVLATIYAVIIFMNRPRMPPRLNPSGSPMSLRSIYLDQRDR